MQLSLSFHKCMPLEVCNTNIHRSANKNGFNRPIRLKITSDYFQLLVGIISCVARWYHLFEFTYLLFNEQCSLHSQFFGKIYWPSHWDCDSCDFFFEKYPQASCLQKMDRIVCIMRTSWRPNCWTKKNRDNSLSFVTRCVNAVMIERDILFIMDIPEVQETFQWTNHRHQYYAAIAGIWINNSISIDVTYNSVFIPVNLIAMAQGCNIGWVISWDQWSSW